MRIAFFDSGIGGITVLKEALKLLPGEDYIYYADTLHVPYGTKSKEYVREVIFEAVDFLSRQHIKALVVACNTATSVAVRDLRSRYSIPILGMEPAVKPALNLVEPSRSRVLVFATPLTLAEKKFHNLIQRIDDHSLVDIHPLPELVTFAERFDFSDATVLPYLSEVLSKYDLSRYSAIVLGCTHFVLFREHFKKLLPPHVHIVDGNTGTVAYLFRQLESCGLLDGSGSGQVDFFSSGIPMEEKLKSRILGTLLQQP